MKKRVSELTGMRFGRLTVVERAGKSAKGKTMWLCVCDCGKNHVARGDSIKSGAIKSCGCLRSETNSMRYTTHGKSKTRIYRIWMDMKCRGNGLNGKEDYYDRNIRVCDEWQNSFECFYEWAMANGYSDTLSIDRINNDAGYYPENCRWATSGEQAKNKRNNIFITLNERTQTISEWSRELNIPFTTIQKRIRRGLPAEMVLYKGKLKEINEKMQNEKAV